MSKRLSSRKMPLAEINVVPYIDVMLVLLVIFMITAPMLTQGVSVELPQAQSEAVNAHDKEPIIVSVDRTGNYYLNISNTPDNPIALNTMLVRVAAELKLSKQEKQPISVLVKGDQGVSYGKVVQAMGMLKKAGAEQVGLITDFPDDNRGEVG